MEIVWGYDMSRRKYIIAIVGRTGSGKDTVAGYFKKFYNVHPVVSYTTRPIRDNETDGVEHIFVTKDEMEVLRQREDVIAYTQFPETGYEYLALLDEIKFTGVEKGASACTYIVDPFGLEYLNKMVRGTDIEVIELRVEASYSKRLKRLGARGDKPADIERRLASEDAIFDKYESDRRLNEKLCKLDVIINDYNRISLQLQVDTFCVHKGLLVAN